MSDSPKIPQVPYSYTDSNNPLNVFKAPRRGRPGKRRKKPLVENTDIRAPLRAWRTRMGFTLEQAAAALRVSPRTLQGWQYRDGPAGQSEMILLLMWHLEGCPPDQAIGERHHRLTQHLTNVTPLEPGNRLKRFLEPSDP